MRYRLKSDHTIQCDVPSEWEPVPEERPASLPVEEELDEWVRRRCELKCDLTLHELHVVRAVEMIRLLKEEVADLRRREVY